MQISTGKFHVPKHAAEVLLRRMTDADFNGQQVNLRYEKSLAGLTDFPFGKSTLTLPNTAVRCFSGQPWKTTFNPSGLGYTVDELRLGFQVFAQIVPAVLIGLPSGVGSRQVCSACPRSNAWAVFLALNEAGCPVILAVPEGTEDDRQNLCIVPFGHPNVGLPYQEVAS